MLSGCQLQKGSRVPEPGQVRDPGEAAPPAAPSPPCFWLRQPGPAGASASAAWDPHLTWVGDPRSLACAQVMLSGGWGLLLQPGPEGTWGLLVRLGTSPGPLSSVITAPSPTGTGRVVPLTYAYHVLGRVHAPCQPHRVKALTNKNKI